MTQYDSPERRTLEERIASLSGMQAKIALIFILQGKSLADALEIAEGWWTE